MGVPEHHPAHGTLLLLCLVCACAAEPDGLGPDAVHPPFPYRLRWNIEVSYYEQKTFWGLCRYMLRSAKGVGMLVNTINLAYSAMKLLPYTDAGFAEYQGQSVQDFRFALSEAIRELLIFTTFAKSLKNRESCLKVVNWCTIINLLSNL